MKILLVILSFLYAILMAVASIETISYHEYPLILITNLLGVLFIILYVIDYRFLYLGVIILFISAILNGYFILNRVTLSHVTIRLIFSIILISMNFFVHKDSY